MTNELLILIATGASLGFIHTLFGPDHYLPFIVMARTKRWSMLKTALVTFFCGIGHVASSVFLGFVGISFGLALDNLIAFESFRGGLAAWSLIAFGLLYFIWGLRRAAKSKSHTHFHGHANGLSHKHIHTHAEDHVHLHSDGDGNVTPWILFTIFVLGPCEPLIPILMYPAAKSSLAGVVWVSLVFGAVTVFTMCAIVLAAAFGASFIRLGKFERYSHSMAGATICISGLAISFLGL